MSEHCKERVMDSTGWHPYPCSKPAKRDGYCGVHHPDAVARRRAKSYALHARKMADLDSRANRENLKRKLLEAVRVSVGQGEITHPKIVALVRELEAK